MQQGTFSVNRRRPDITYALIAINVAIFAAGFLMELLGRTDPLYAFGVKNNYYIAIGEFWRLLTATFLHASIPHILFNAFALYVWGPHVEALLGRMRYITVYLFAGLCGSLLSFLCSPSNSVGASGAIFGLFGALLYFRSRHKHVFNQVFGIQVLVIIGFNLVNGLMNQGIDNFGHIGGLIGGYLCCYVTGLYGEKWNVKRMLLAIGLCAVYLFALYYGASFFLKNGIPALSFQRFL